MQKLTIFFIVATFSIVAVTSTVIAFEFSNRHSVSEEIYEEPEENNVIVSSKPVKEIKNSTFNFTQTEVYKSESPDPFLASIDKELLVEAGFIDPRLFLKPFNGTVFNEFDLSSIQDDNHISYITFQNGEIAANINEIQFPNTEISREVYNSLRNLIEDEELFLVNETNQYGNASFFANNSEEKKSVFLVVMIERRLYTFHYPAKNHNKIKNLIELLNK